MEIYNNGSTDERRVYLRVPLTPTGTTMNVTAYRNGVLAYTFNTVAAVSDGFYVTLPYTLVQHEGEIELRWQFDYIEDGQSQTFKQSTFVEVVTPILQKSEILDIHPNATPDEIVKIEKAVRHIINAHCGQTFGRFVGTKKVQGRANNNFLQLPVRLLSLTKVNGHEGLGYFVDGDGWIIRKSLWGVPPLKADYYGLHYQTNGVIHNPNNVRLGMFDSRPYEIEGTWGWAEVPGAVKEAAKLLVNDYACADATYRDRFLTSMTAADWRIQFHPGAFRNTGNVRADQLLQGYTVGHGWAVV